MGPDDRWLEQQEEHGHSLDLDKNFLEVCPDCIADDGLRRFVANHAPIQRCDFCGGPGPHGLTLGVLFDYMGDRIGTEYDRAIDELFYGEGDETWESGGATVYDASDLLSELDEPLANDELREAFVDAFPDDRISRHAFRLAYHEQLAYGWETFARFVKEQSRFLFLRTGGQQEGDVELIPPAQLLEELGKALENGDLIRILQPGERQLYRARQHGPEHTLATPAELGSPPRERSGANRMSPAGIPMFYGSEDAETALAELRLEPAPRLVTVATWTTARRLRYLDLVDVDVPSLFDVVGKRQRPWRLFLTGFAADVSQPASPGGAAVDYVPTQVFTEYVRHVLGGSDPVRGIRYRSAIRPEGVSWVLFVDAGGCTEASPAWEADPRHWLGLDRSSLQRFEPVSGWRQIL